MTDQFMIYVDPPGRADRFLIYMIYLMLPGGSRKKGMI